MSSVVPLTFWLRAEVKAAERRTPLTPVHAKLLRDAGHKVIVERSKMRCFPDEQYAELGFELVPEGAWLTSPPPLDTIIVGLKELPESTDPLAHRHIYFAHCFKNQAGWRELLQRFAAGNGSLYDLEFLHDDRGRRVAAFGRSAGFNGMALGLKQWAVQQLGQASMGPLDFFPSSQSLVDDVRAALDAAAQATGRRPKVLVVGALGRCGQGSVDFARRAGLTADEIVEWDLAETRAGGPFPALLDVDVLCNCIYLSGPIPPFITNELLQGPRRLTVLADISCDSTNVNNPVPVYTEGTTFQSPSLRTIDGPLPFDVIAIDHLPSLVPVESSAEFSEQILPHLVQCGQTDVWHRADRLFREKLSAAKGCAL
eukprot:TRINITY_DN11977_c0_g1_i1.p2 TRINITY_DN11977_c0_g1~~TRINITY_DN11977_c0_g1_i1.p2  ORF type:complete len:370 (-),score=110.81 TRINITY_DN11977_c0_g1_i1:693-1802(-)